MNYLSLTSAFLLFFLTTLVAAAPMGNISVRQSTHLPTLSILKYRLTVFSSQRLWRRRQPVDGCFRRGDYSILQRPGPVGCAIRPLIRFTREYVFMGSVLFLLFGAKGAREVLDSTRF